MTWLLLIIAVAGFFGLLFYFGDRNDSKLSYSCPNNYEASCEEDPVESARLIKEKLELKEEAEFFKSEIKGLIKNLEYDNRPEYQNVNSVYINELNKILNLSCSSRYSLEYARFLFNNGNLRTEQEKAEYTFKLQGIHYSESGEYEEDCKRTNLSCAIIPFGVVFAIICLIFIADGYFIWWLDGLFALVPALFAMFIGIMVGHTRNIHKAEEMGVAPYNERLRKEKFNRNAGIVAGIAGAASMGHHINQARKDIENVDSWKQMK